MSENSKIEWTDAIWNPVLGCDKISPGCENCYAIRTAWRLQHNPNPKVKAAFEGLTVLQGGQPNWTGRVRLVEERLREPLKWRTPRRIFVNSQSDLFHEGLSDEQIDRVVTTMGLANQHTFQVLTKRPERMRDYMQRLAKNIKPLETIARDMGYTFKWTSPLDGKEYGLLPWPIPQVWLGTSVESPKYKDRIDKLRETPAAVRFLSLEPLLEDLGIIDLTGIHWCIVGGESGPGARPMNPDWARSIRDQCKAAGVPYFHKQNGEYERFGMCSSAKEGEDIGEVSGRFIAGDYDEKLRSRWVYKRVGKKASGRKLDGVEHSEYPTP